MKFMKIKSNSTQQNWQITQKRQKDKTLVFQKNQQKMQTCINL